MNDVSCCQKVFGIDPDKINSETRSRLIKEMEDLISRVEKEARDLTDEEKKAWDFAFQILKQTACDKLNVHQRASTGADVRASKLDSGFIGKRYREIFPNVRLDMGEYESTEQFFRTVAGGAEKRKLLSEVGTSGGFNVPGFLSDQLFNLALEQSICLPRVRVYPMQGATLQIPAWDSKDHQNGPIGNFSVQWLGEALASTAVTPRLRAVTRSDAM